MWNKIIISEVKKYLNEAPISSFTFDKIATNDYFRYLKDLGYLEHQEYSYWFGLKNKNDFDKNELKKQVFDDLYYEYVDFIKDMEDIISNNNGYVPIYREMTVKDDWLEHLKKDGKRLGIYWSWDESSAEAHLGDYSLSNTGRIHSIVREEHVDWESTIRLNLDPIVGYEEKEIRLFKNTPLTIKHLYINGVEQDITDISNKTFYA